MLKSQTTCVMNLESQLNLHFENREMLDAYRTTRYTTTEQFEHFFSAAPITKIIFLHFMRLIINATSMDFHASAYNEYWFEISNESADNLANVNILFFGCIVQ